MNPIRGGDCQNRKSQKKGNSLFGYIPHGSQEIIGYLYSFEFKRKKRDLMDGPRLSSNGLLIESQVGISTEKKMLSNARKRLKSETSVEVPDWASAGE